MDGKGSWGGTRDSPMRCRSFFEPMSTWPGGAGFNGRMPSERLFGGIQDIRRLGIHVSHHCLFGSWRRRKASPRVSRVEVSSEASFPENPDLPATSREKPRGGRARERERQRERGREEERRSPMGPLASPNPHKKKKRARELASSFKP